MAAITRHMTGDLAFSLNASSQLTVLKDVKFSCPADLVEGKSLTDPGENEQAVKQEVIVATTMQSYVSSGPERVANVDVSAFTIGGTNFLGYLMGYRFSASHKMVELGGVSNYWKYTLPTTKQYSAEVQLSIPDSTTANAIRTFLGGFMNATIGTAIAARRFATSITINGIEVALTTLAQDAQWSGEDGGVQILTLPLKGYYPSTTYPTAPTGTTTILEKALNARQTALAGVFTPKSSNSGSFAGDLVIDTFGFRVQDKAVVETDYSWRSHGVWAYTAN